MRRLAILALVLGPGCLWSRGGSGDHCPRDRTVELGLQDEVQKLAGCTQVGSVIIRTGATIEVSPLHELEEIQGDLMIGPTVGIDEVAFNGLLRVGGTIRVANNGSLRGLYFPRLEEAGRVEVDNNAVLGTISMPRLTAVKGALVITDNTNLELLTASLLASVGKELVISGHPKLALLEMSRLVAVEAIRFEGNPKVPAEVVESLTSKSALGSAAPSP
jgi:hypothetical protein